MTVCKIVPDTVKVSRPQEYTYTQTLTHIKRQRKNSSNLKKKKKSFHIFKLKTIAYCFKSLPLSVFF